MTWTLLLSLLVKSSIVAGAGLVCARFLTQRPVDRVDILRGTVCLLVALPVIMNVLPALDLALLPPSATDLASAAASIGTGQAAAIGGSAHGVVKGGLTDRGREMVHRMEARGMLVDVAHASVIASFAERAKKGPIRTCWH